MIYILIYLFIETLVSVEIASQIGGLNTFFEIVISALLGIYFLKTLHENVVDDIVELAKGEISFSQFTSRTIWRAVGAVLLIVPGFFTDILGILFQLSFITDAVVNIFTPKSRELEDSNIIDVEDINKKSLK